MAAAEIQPESRFQLVPNIPRHSSIVPRRTSSGRQAGGQQLGGRRAAVWARCGRVCVWWAGGRRAGRQRVDARRASGWQAVVRRAGGRRTYGWAAGARGSIPRAGAHIHTLRVTKTCKIAHSSAVSHQLDIRHITRGYVAADPLLCSSIVLTPSHNIEVPRSRRFDSYG